MGSALRTSTSGQISRSHCYISGTFSAFNIGFVETPLGDGEKSCWHALFFNPVIAYNFPMEEREYGEGLEIPVHMMAALGGASKAVEFEGGLLLKGFSSMFVPMRRAGAYVQWHYVRNDDDSRLPYWEVDDRCPGRASFQDVDYDAIATTRAFLGWWGNTTSHLGTADVNYDNLDWSDTKEPGRSIEFHGGSLGFQNIGAGELDFSPGPKDGKLHISRSGPYRRIIKYASRTPVVLYDTCEKRGWLVPSSAVIAHISQTRHFRKRFSINGTMVELIPTDPLLNVYDGAAQMLLKNFSTRLGDDNDDDDELGMGEFHFRDLVLNIWTLLERLLDEDIRKRSTKDPSLRGTLRSKLRGWEFMDVVDERSPVRLKETTIQKSSGGWVDLVQDLNAIVLFASGFEDIIKPTQDTAVGLCHKWQRVPKDKDYLTASVPILNSFYEEAGSRLTRKYLTSTHLQWHRGEVLFEACPNRASYECTCDRLQQIFHESALTFGKVKNSGQLDTQGAVIFGQSGHFTKARAAPHRQKGEDFIYSQENVPLLQCADLSGVSVACSEKSYDQEPFPTDVEGGHGTETSESQIESSHLCTYDEKKELPQRMEHGTRKRSRLDQDVQERPRSVQRQRVRHESRLNDPKCELEASGQLACLQSSAHSISRQPTLEVYPDSGDRNTSMTHRLRRRPALQSHKTNLPLSHYASEDVYFERDMKRLAADSKADLSVDTQPIAQHSRMMSTSSK